MARKIWRVSQHETGWQVKRDGASRASRTFKTKKSAVAAARKIARGHQPSRVVIHRSDGTVQGQDSYGDEPWLPYAGVFEGPSDLGLRSEKYLAEHFALADAAE